MSKVDLSIGDTQVILAECKRRNVLRNQAAYILATALWETAHTMKPVREAYWLSEAWRKKNLRYYPWYGRGYVQLTWQTNYERAGRELDVDLTTDPDVAMRPEIAVPVLVKGCMRGWFTGASIPDYITLQSSNFIAARRVVNGTDKAHEIAELAEAYDEALRASGYGVEPAPRPDWVDPEDGARLHGNKDGAFVPTNGGPGGFWAALIKAIFGGRS